MAEVTNIKFAGLGGMGVLSAANVMSQLAFRVGYDVKKAEVHGMSQRGGSLCSDVRYGPLVLSPMIPLGEVDFLVCLAVEWQHLHVHELRPTGRLLSAAAIDSAQLTTRKALNVAMLGLLSRHLNFPDNAWLASLRECFPAKLHNSNEHAFRLGQTVGSETPIPSTAQMAGNQP